MLKHHLLRLLLLHKVPTQSLATQTALNEAANRQQRLNMELGAELDRTNAEFFAHKILEEHRQLQQKIDYQQE